MTQQHIPIYSKQVAYFSRKMLDPLNAISLASSIVQFVQFGTKLVLEGLELYQSNDGALAKNSELEAIVKDINQRSEVLINTPQPSEDEVAMQKLAESSRKIADELIEQLSTLRIPVSHKRLQSSRKALAAAWKKDRITDLERRLCRLQNQINQRLVFMMRFFTHSTCAKTSLVDHHMQ